MKRSIVILTVGCALALPVTGQNRSTLLVTQQIDETQIVKLHGNVHPLAQARYDRGGVPDAFPAERVLLLLNRPADKESALQQFLEQTHWRGSATYRQWLTPQEFGERFRPADSDVAKVTKSKQFLEFSGTAGQLGKAFHTEIHQYDVEGEMHYANAGELRVGSSSSSPQILRSSMSGADYRIV